MREIIYIKFFNWKLYYKYKLKKNRNSNKEILLSQKHKYKDNSDFIFLYMINKVIVILLQGIDFYKNLEKSKMKRIFKRLKFTK